MTDSIKCNIKKESKTVMFVFKSSWIFHQFSDPEFISGYYQNETDYLVLHNK